MFLAVISFRSETEQLGSAGALAGTAGLGFFGLAPCVISAPERIFRDQNS
jgi:hypothetical protein